MHELTADRRSDRDGLERMAGLGINISFIASDQRRRSTLGCLNREVRTPIPAAVGSERPDAGAANKP